MKVLKKDESDGKLKRLDVLSIIYFFVFSGVAIVFFYLQKRINDANFGFVEWIFVIVFAVFVTWFLIWIKSVIYRNPYLGVSIGLLVMIAMAYGFSVRYYGKYTYTFMFVVGVLIIFYLGIYFFKYREGEKQIPNEFDEK